MNNRQIARTIEEFQRIRSDWIERLVANPRNMAASQHILSINTKIELLETFWNWSDETVDFPH